jgi:hypothetical protein
MAEPLAMAGALATLALGLLGLLAPARVASLIGIGADGALGRSEVRATYGGVFIGLGAACLALRAPEAFAVAAAAWLFASLARLASLAVERDASGRNLGGVAVEGGIGLALLSGWL